MEVWYHSWIMIAVFLVIMPGMIYGAYKLKILVRLWSPIRTQLNDTKPIEEKKYTPKDNSKNIKKMKEIEENEENYIPERQKLRALILNTKEELENDKNT